MEDKGKPWDALWAQGEAEARRSFLLYMGVLLLLILTLHFVSKFLENASVVTPEPNPRELFQQTLGDPDYKGGAGGSF